MARAQDSITGFVAECVRVSGVRSMALIRFSDGSVTHKGCHHHKGRSELNLSLCMAVGGGQCAEPLGVYLREATVDCRPRSPHATVVMNAPKFILVFCFVLTLVETSNVHKSKETV